MMTQNFKLNLFVGAELSVAQLSMPRQISGAVHAQELKLSSGGEIAAWLRLPFWPQYAGERSSQDETTYVFARINAGAREKNVIKNAGLKATRVQSEGGGELPPGFALQGRDGEQLILKGELQSMVIPVQLREDWKLFVDDLRKPEYLEQTKTHGQVFAFTTGPWHVAINQWEAQALITAKGLPSVISFDHDYGEEEQTGNGHHLAQWLAERHIEGTFDLRAMNYQVHSSNPEGKRNIIGVLEDIRRFAPGDPTPVRRSAFEL